VRPKLSVVIAHHNRNAQLALALRFWRRQRGLAPDEVELVVVDDGSVVVPARLCAEHAARLVHCPPSANRRGPSTPWTEGLRAAEGEVLACTHPEIVPGLDVARYLYGVPAGAPELLEGLEVWIPEAPRPGDVAVRERALCYEDVPRLAGHAVRANAPVYRLHPDHAQVLAVAQDPAAVEGAAAFWDRETEFGGHSNLEIRHRFRAFFWNNLFSMRAELWRWIGYHRPSDDWGIDDTDFQERNRFLGITYAFTSSVFGYHLWHGPECRSGLTDLHDWKDLEDARLVWLYPETAGAECPLRRGDFWASGRDA
jgi:glycosyltransferase involved in cell wall biosynthesis